MNEPQAAAWMGRLMELSRGDGELPDPALIWWKARLLEKHATRARLARPTAIAQWASLAIAILTIIVLCTVNWPGIRSMLGPAGAVAWLAVAGSVIAMGLALRFVLSE